MINWEEFLILYENYDGNWERFFDDVYNSFRNDFVVNKPKYLDVPISLKKYPMYDGKEATFWHITSNGENEDEREPDLRRCERIKWPAITIENSQKDEFLVWENTRRGNTRILIYIQSQDFLVVLEKRETYTLFVTAYPVTRSHRQKKLMKEYENYKRQEPQA